MSLLTIVLILLANYKSLLTILANIDLCVLFQKRTSSFQNSFGNSFSFFRIQFETPKLSRNW